LPGADELDKQLGEARKHLEELRRELSNLEGQLEERKTIGRDPGEAEERHASAQEEFERVQRLSVVLKKTRSVLSAAQEQVHRNIAPRLNAATDRWMPYLFDDRYQRVLIDPESLSVKVLTGQVARDAIDLSQGTAEQIYLLLRIALVDTLTAASNESCPMILDDVTVHFDAERKVAVLDLLHQVSQERQVIIFSQEEAVRSWAQDNLEATDRLIELAGRVQP
jgi:exonuclease SbcC